MANCGCAQRSGTTGTRRCAAAHRPAATRRRARPLPSCSPSAKPQRPAATRGVAEHQRPERAPPGPVRDKQQLWRIDQQTNAVKAKIPLGRDPERRIEAFGSIWVSDPEEGTIRRIDPATNKVAARLDVPGVFGLGAAGGSLWGAIASSGTVVRSDPKTLKIVARIRYGPPKADDVARLVADADAVWIQNQDTLFRLDPATSHVVSTLRLPGADGRSDGEIAVGAGSVWITNAEEGTLARVDKRLANVPWTRHVVDSDKPTQRSPALRKLMFVLTAAAALSVQLTASASADERHCYTPHIGSYPSYEVCYFLPIEPTQ